MEWWQILLLLAGGIACGFLNVLAGGGSMLTVPILLFLGLPGPVANGSNRVAIIAQNITAVGTFLTRARQNMRRSVTLALATLPGTLLGAAAGTRLEGEWFDRVVAVVMLLTLGFMLFGGGGATKVDTAQRVSRRRVVIGHCAMLLVGFWGGFIQIGVGFLIMPVLHRLMGMSLLETNMHKVFIVLVLSVVALAVFQAAGQVWWTFGLVLAAGNALGGWLGAHFSLRVSDRVIRGFFIVIVLAFIAELLLR
ncbi:MAG: sulfite exporter TauE/SafE family protein [Gammaproteobacteria bacterium]|nr:sulfite exporter TauE/SafE family protein [Gammaproteobacteria bacterium]